MTIKFMMIWVVGLTIFSCSKSRESVSDDEISGTYAREYSFKVVNPESNNEIGMRTIRDTILIRLVDNGYEVSNKKWRMNDYDKEGWQSMEHSDDRPMPSYMADFMEADAAIHPRNSDQMPLLYIDLSKQTVFRNKAERHYYQKIR